MTERAESAGLLVWIVPQRPGVDLLWVVRLARRLRHARIDVLHTHEFEMNIFGGAAGLLARIPAISTIHGRHWVTDRPRRALAYRALRSAPSTDRRRFGELGSVPGNWLEATARPDPGHPQRRCACRDAHTHWFRGPDGRAGPAFHSRRRPAAGRGREPVGGQGPRHAAAGAVAAAQSPCGDRRPRRGGSQPAQAGIGARDRRANASSRASR